MANCKNCGAELVSGAKFCMECGTPVPQVPHCTNCGAELIPGAKFCMECGTPVPQEEKKGRIQMGDANAISAQNVVGGDLEIVHGNKEIINGNQINAGNYTVNNVTNEAGFAQNSVNVAELLEKAKAFYNDGNYFKALEIFREIADQDVEAQYAVGCCYRDGDGTKQDYIAAVQWFEKAGGNGYPDALADLACMYVSDHYGMKNVSKAIGLFTTAANRGNLLAQENLAEIYYTGYHVHKDEKAALNWALKATKKYVSNMAELVLAILYFNGNVIRKDTAQAIQLIDNIDTWLTLDECLEYDRQVIEEAVLLYAWVRENDIDGFGDYELAKFDYQWLIDKYDSQKASDQLDKMMAEDKSIIHRYEECMKDGYGVEFSNDKTILTGGHSDERKELINDYIVPNTVTKIGDFAFDGCSALTSINIPNSVTSIGNYAFRDCSGLTSVNIPNSVTSFGNYVFEGCSALTSINIPKSVTSIGSYVFNNCPIRFIEINSQNVIEKGIYDADTIKLDKNIIKIPENAFLCCRKLKTLLVCNESLMQDIIANKTKYGLKESVEVIRN